MIVEIVIGIVGQVVGIILSSIDFRLFARLPYSHLNAFSSFSMQHLLHNST